MIHPRFAAMLGCAVVVAATSGAFAQQPAETQPTGVPASAPAERTAISAIVLEVRGDVLHAPLDSNDWQPCKVDDQYPQETVIQTGVRSSVKLQVGSDDTYTAVIIESASQVILSEAYQTPDSKRIRMGVGYGRMRAGVAEGGLKSDFTVDSPVATLSKRGTWNFGLFYERATGRFDIFLLDRGLVDAFSKATGQRRSVQPREFVTQVMRRWLDEAQFVRNVAIPDMLGQSDISVAFNELSTSGLLVVNPEGGQVVLLDLTSPPAQDQFAALARGSLALFGTAALTGVRPRTLTRPEGFFGTGRGDELVPVIIGQNSPLAQKGFARPGTYNFRRSALEGWLQQQGRR